MGGLSIVVVEDDALIGLLPADLLAGLGHTVCATAATESEAVAGTLRSAPDLMLVDLELAQGDGRSAMQTILRARPRRRVLMTGAGRDQLPPGASCWRSRSSRPTRSARSAAPSSRRADAARPFNRC